MHEDDTIAWLRDQADEALAGTEPVRTAGSAALVGAIAGALPLVIFLIALAQI